MKSRWIVALAAAASAACAERSVPEANAPSWEGEVGGLFEEACTGCHSELSDYSTVAECRADSILPALERPDHAELLSGAQLERVRAWVVDSSLAFSDHLAHEPGWSLSHGTVLARDGYRAVFAGPETQGSCAKCHDAPASKGGAVPCATCHGESFAENRCGSCHGGGDDPRPRAGPCDSSARRAAIGAHALHTVPSASPEYPAIACTTCHEVPAGALDSGHFDPGEPDGRADVRFEAAGASWDPATRACSVSGCHATSQPVWTSTSTGARCDSCHGEPPPTPSHASARCSSCHGDALAANGRPDARFHLDGLVQVGSGCNDCHRDPIAPSLANGPGAHAAHLGPGIFAAPRVCADCHLAPAEVSSPGHIDSELPAEVTLAFDVRTRRCADVGCHGANLDGGLKLTPAWVESSTVSLECGSCHGLPPRTVRGGAALHLATGPAECGACHRTAEGLPITEGTRAITAAGLGAHIDGCVELERGCP